MYVQVLLIKIHRRATGVRCHFGSPVKSGIFQGAAQRLEFRGNNQRLKFSQTSTSETQSKWLIQKRAMRGKWHNLAK